MLMRSVLITFVLAPLMFLSQISGTKAEDFRTIIGGFEKVNELYPASSAPMTGPERLYWVDLSQFVRDLGQQNLPILKGGYYFMPEVGSMPVKSVKLSDDNGILINLDANIARKYTEDDLEQFWHFLTDEAIRLMELRNKTKPSAVIVVYDGYSYSYHRPKKQGDLLQRRKASRAPAVSGPVVVSEGHGLYRKLDAAGVFVGWVYQRALVNNIREDELTPDYADELESWLVSRSGSDVRRTRNPSSTNYGPANAPWRNVAARYNLKNILPNNPEIWDSPPNPNSANEPVKKYENQDIRSRPFYANFLNAAVLIGLHSNAAASSSAKGGRIYYDTRLSENGELARHIGCYMKDFIHAKCLSRNILNPLNRL